MIVYPNLNFRSFSVFSFPFFLIGDCGAKWQRDLQLSLEVLIVAAVEKAGLADKMSNNRRWYKLRAS